MGVEDCVPYLLLGRPQGPDLAAGRTLQLHILLDSESVGEWTLEALRLLARAPGIALAGLYWISRPARRPQWPCRAYLHACAPGGGEPAAVWALGTRTEFASTPQAPWPGGLGSTARGVLLYLGGSPMEGETGAGPDLEVWSVCFGDPEDERVAPPLLWEWLEERGVLTASLIRHEAAWSRGRVVSRYAVGAQPALRITLPLQGVLRPVGAMILQRLFDMLQYGRGHIDGIAGQAPERTVLPRFSDPSWTALPRFLARRLAESARMNWRQRRFEKCWFTSWRGDVAQFTPNTGRFTGVGFREYQGVAGHGYADPFPYRWQDRDYLFLEEILPGGRGRLVVASVGADGPGPPAVILDRPSHLSYPLVFLHEGEHYLLPETRATRRVELYRAVRFPLEWELYRVLAEGVPLIDTTPIFHEGLWYFFTTLQSSGVTAMQGLLFHATRLDGEWTAHPANPISADARRSRAAGQFFRRGGRLLRPVQDCSSDYGRAVRLMEVLRLTATEYAEKEVEFIGPEWHPRAIRTHTLNSSSKLEAIDGSMWMPKAQPGGGARG